LFVFTGWQGRRVPGHRPVCVQVISSLCTVFLQCHVTARGLALLAYIVGCSSACVHFAEHLASIVRIVV
jgi:hypothetical protein